MREGEGERGGGRGGEVREGAGRGGRGRRAGWRVGRGGRVVGGVGWEGSGGGRGGRVGGGGGGQGCGGGGREGAGVEQDGEGAASPAHAARRPCAFPPRRPGCVHQCPWDPRSQAARACPGSWRPSSDELRAQRAWLGLGPRGVPWPARRLRTQHTRRPQPHPTPAGNQTWAAGVPELRAHGLLAPRALPAGASSPTGTLGAGAPARAARREAGRPRSRPQRNEVAPPSAQAARGPRRLLALAATPSQAPAGLRSACRPGGLRAGGRRWALGCRPPAEPCPVRKAAYLPSGCALAARPQEPRARDLAWRGARRRLLYAGRPARAPGL